MPEKSSKESPEKLPVESQENQSEKSPRKSNEISFKKGVEKSPVKTPEISFKESSNIIYTCNFCGKTFQELRLLRLHNSKSHSRERNFKCNLCEMAFFQEANLEKHVSFHDMYSKTVLQSNAS